MPGGYELFFNYEDGLDDDISRLSSIEDSTGFLEDYTYQGASTVEERFHEQQGTGGVLLVTGFDDFNRVDGQTWIDIGSVTVMDAFAYGHDRNGNVLYKENLVNADFSELYTYDDLNRLETFARGELNGPKDAIATPTDTQEWDFDAVGNATAVTTDGSLDNRPTNTQNQVTQAFGESLEYDNNGNLLNDEHGNQFVYDAWNRLVNATDDEDNPLSAYQYDGLHRRITEDPGTLRDFYYSGQQVLSESVGGTPTLHYVWSPVYVDAMVLRFDGTDRIWVQQDANFNVTSISDDDGAVVERYTESPYGVVTVYDDDWTPDADGESDVAWLHYQQGKRFDFVIGLYDYNARWYSPTLEKFITEDSAQDGANWYGYEGGSPVTSLDPTGHDTEPKPMSWFEFPKIVLPESLRESSFADQYLREFTKALVGLDEEKLGKVYRFPYDVEIEKRRKISFRPDRAPRELFNMEVGPDDVAKAMAAAAAKTVLGSEEGAAMYEETKGFFANQLSVKLALAGAAAAAPHVRLPEFVPKYSFEMDLFKLEVQSVNRIPGLLDNRWTWPIAELPRVRALQDFDFPPWMNFNVGAKFKFEEERGVIQESVTPTINFTLSHPRFLRGGHFSWYGYAGSLSSTRGGVGWKGNVGATLNFGWGPPVEPDPLPGDMRKQN